MAGSAVAAKRAASSAGKNTTFREVFAVREFLVLWLAQLLSIAGDQLARVALSVLVYDRTRSALLAAVTFAASIVPVFAGSMALSWLADVFPRRTVMVICDLVSLALVGAMAVPGVPLAALIALLFLVTLASAPFMAARYATNREVLGPDRYQLGSAVTQTTYQVGQAIGFAAGGGAVAVVGVRGALLIDAGTFAASALLIGAGVRYRPAAGGKHGPRSPQIWSGTRLVFASQVARTALLIELLAVAFDAPEGVAAPLARELGGGPATVGLLLAAMTAGSAAGFSLCGRLAGPAWRMRSTAVLAGCACAVLIGFVFSPPRAAALAILAGSGLCSCFMLSSGAAFANAIPDEHRGKAFGVANGALCLGQGAMILVAGAAAGLLGAEPVIAIIGAAGTAAAAPLVLAWRKIRPPA
jgi:MFS family permease